MLRTTGPQAKPDIQRAIDTILKQDSNFDRNENRTAHRENLVRAISLEVRDPEELVDGFSRNVSATGIGVITSTEIQAGKSAVLIIASLDGRDLKILSECRWCKPYGNNWFLSGWQFINLKR